VNFRNKMCIKAKDNPKFWKEINFEKEIFLTIHKLEMIASLRKSFYWFKQE